MIRTDRIVVALIGPYTSGGMGFIENVKRGQAMAAKLMALGFSPICPWLDYPLEFFEDLTKRDFQETFAAQLVRADVVLALPGWGKSEGALMDRRIAVEAGKLVVYSIETLQSWAASNSQRVHHM